MLEAIPFTIYRSVLFAGDQMMPQGIIRNLLVDTSRHHQGVNG